MDDITREEKKLLRAKTPHSYIDSSLNSGISSGRKAMLTRLWLKEKGYSIEDIKYARNRHPYWKGRKMEGTAERNLKRTVEHDYSDGSNIIWDDDLLMEFIDSNKKDDNGKYEYRDWELAEYFECTIPAIQHMRRKYNMAVKIINKKYGRVTDKRLLKLISLNEGQLRGMVKKR